MNFQRRKIQSIPSKEFRLFTPKKTIVLSALVAFLMIMMAYNIIKGVSLKSVVFFFGQTLEEDNYGHTNILLLGTGGEGHDGPDLTDTLIIASIDQTDSRVSLFSIPRDFYITDKKVGGTRINNLYHLGKNELGDKELGIRMLKEHIEEITNLPLHYYLKVDFQGFEKVVDILDGIDVQIPEAIYDPQYPRGEDIGYEIFSLPEGLQHLDGETALKYARSRKTTSDFDRSKRQQLLLFAIKEKAEKEGLLTDTGALQDMYEAVEQYVDTDLSLREMITLGKVGSQIKRENILSHGIHDDPTQCGGLLYTPARDLYNGASVLVPATKDNKDIHLYTEVNLNHPEIRQSGIKLQILNGTKSIGLAAETKILLNRLCMNVIRFGNGQSKDVAKTTYYLKHEVPKSVLDALQKLIPGEALMVIPPKYLEPQYVSDADIIIEIGQDYLPRKMVDPYDFIVPLTPTTPVVTGEAAPKTATTPTPITPKKT